MIELLINYLDDDSHNIYTYILTGYKRYVRYLILKSSNLFIYVLSHNLQYILKTLKYSSITRMNILIDIFGTDYPGQKNRFKIIYNLASSSNLVRIFCVIFTKPLVKIPSVTNIYFSAT